MSNTNIAIILIIGGVSLLSLFLSTRTVVFSSTKSQITQNNTPMKNTTVIRRYDWQGKIYQDQTTTDENGFFSFPSKYIYTLTRLFPMELVVGQEMALILDGKEKIFWTNSKRSAKEGSEFFSEKLNKQVALTCDISKENTTTRDFNSVTKTMCTWE